MEQAEYDLMDAQESRMWWYRALHARLADALAEVRGTVLDADGAEDNAGCILDQHAAGDGDEGAAHGMGDGGDEKRLLLRAVEQGARSHAHAHGECAMRFALGDFAAFEAGAVLGAEGFQRAAGIERVRFGVVGNMLTPR